MAKLINLKIFSHFFRSSSAGGIFLLICVLISLLIANSQWSEGFKEILNFELGFNTSTIHLKYPILLWVNDGLMAVFFLLVGLEIKREIVEGELASFAQAALPVLAAIGGVLVPALIYLFFNNGDFLTSKGWGIPMATDIAFALGILSLLGNKVPSGLKIFLAALAIVDDLIAILVIAIFYSSDLHFLYLGYAGALFVLLIIFNRMGFKNLLFYLIPGVFIWYFIHHSGIHATIAGVLVAITLPTNEDDTDSPLEKLEHALTSPVNFIIMPIFALVNTNITFESVMIDGLTSNLGLGIILGLFLGKPIGIFIMSWLSVKLKIAALPESTTWFHVLGLGLLGGIGFTMSIFIALLSFQDPLHQNEAKFAILIASTIAGIAGFCVLNLYNKRQKQKI
ncbi:Na+/H+ antiporter NhaA [Flavobacterium sp. Fl-77]|uniref:Na(+)/H(+) antiporter NhaA n=1 Tax=Flavobacterium flavipigmentatum TaxID=2893884 RepID=A0AAJ2SEK1_9FLAO|nr:MULTISPECIES: Na+/H+ antiporter NhaA [unclassified Flavobacterium]MDX6182049.1 Na+/H+ antiporter NhaA [Flavobacterium sp. Fl-33]MDX6186896.1 Na+/H+ antiporter NhaA [Flavobacterium sp. Fl-77]UFH37030.1 Na+/H+ antiporter NhaA [Flavobacterium sp. F-70]